MSTKLTKSEEPRERRSDSSSRTLFARAILQAARVKMAAKNSFQKECVAAISPTPDALIDAVLSEELIFCRSIYSIIDMGCGDGRWLVRCAAKFSGCICVGIDIDPDRIETSSKMVQLAGFGSRIELVQGILATRSHFL
jgi:tRNA1(Val) A37 N6-methylase TrmN6